jgi:large subunit ribosomal protein L25
MMPALSPGAACFELRAFCFLHLQIGNPSRALPAPHPATGGGQPVSVSEFPALDFPHSASFHPMSKPQTLQAHTRKRSGSAALKRLRREGLIPAIIYGRQQENVNLRLQRKSVNELMGRSVSEQILVNLEIEDRKETKLALIQAVQHDPLTGQILHMDFHAVREDEILHAHVLIELVGEAAGVKAGGLLEFLMHSLDIQCLPKDLPEKIVVDVSNVNIGEAIHIRDLNLPEGVKASSDGDISLVRVSEPKVADEPTPAAAAAAAATAAATPAAGGAPAAAAKPAGGAKPAAGGKK